MAWPFIIIIMPDIYELITSEISAMLERDFVAMDTRGKEVNSGNFA